MEGQGEGLSGKTTERSEYLKSFSDGDLLGELEKRLRSNSNIDPKILQRLKTTTAELEKRAEALKQSQTEQEKPAEINIPVVDSKVESSAESEGKKWAKIIREKGAGSLYGKFRRSWGYYDESGSFHSILPSASQEKVIGFSSGGYVGKDKVPKWSRTVQAETIRIDRNTSDTSSNFLVVGDAGLERSENEGFKGWKTFSYLTWFNSDNAVDPRGTINLQFNFTLPPEESSQYLDDVNKNPDLAEDLFQNVYPGFTGEKGLKRSIVNKLTLIDNIVTTEEEDYISVQRRKRDKKEKPTYNTIVVDYRSKLLNFSKPVGEIAS